MAVRFCSKWCHATPAVDALVSRFRLASSRYIVHESANMKVCLYRVIISNGFFEETNEQRIFSKVF